ncbi:porin [Oceanimonas smirnovii]|uniref:porin n=1 Tax=Oceanimonas smirnovii TaxID=264574 RepID=UPI00037AE7FD|nr:porin [Oceanimonas smirnovii]
MKKTILALTIPALFATSASAVTVYSDEGAKVDIYGRIQYEAGEMGFKKDDATANNFGGEGEARLGVNVEYALNNDIDLIGKLEWQVVAEGDDATGSDNLSTRYAWAGYRFQDTTELTFGRSQDPIAQVLYLSDIFNIFGGRAGYGDRFELNDKVDDQVRVSYAANGLDLRGAYAFSDGYKLEKAGNGSELDNQWSLSAGYTFPVGVGVYAAYEQQDVRGKNEDSIDAWFAGASYTVDGFFFSGLYTQREYKDIDTKGFELTGTYNVDAWTLLAQYSYEEVEETAKPDFDSIDAWTLGVQYDLTAKAKLYAEYEINDDDLNRDDRYGMGIQYNF